MSPARPHIPEKVISWGVVMDFFSFLVFGLH